MKRDWQWPEFEFVVRHSPIRPEMLKLAIAKSYPFDNWPATKYKLMSRHPENVHPHVKK